MVLISERQVRMMLRDNGASVDGTPNTRAARLTETLKLPLEKRAGQKMAREAVDFAAEQMVTIPKRDLRALYDRDDDIPGFGETLLQFLGFKRRSRYSCTVAGIAGVALLFFHTIPGMPGILDEDNPRNWMINAARLVMLCSGNEMGKVAVLVSAVKQAGSLTSLLGALISSRWPGRLWSILLPGRLGNGGVLPMEDMTPEEQEYYKGAMKEAYSWMGIKNYEDYLPYKSRLWQTA